MSRGIGMLLGRECVPRDGAVLARQISNLAGGRISLIAAGAAVAEGVEMSASAGAIARGVDVLLMDVIHCGSLQHIAIFRA